MPSQFDAASREVEESSPRRAFQEAPGEAEAEAAREAFLAGATASPAVVARQLAALDPATRAQALARLQRERGNAYVQRVIARDRGQPGRLVGRSQPEMVDEVIQRKDEGSPLPGNARSPLESFFAADLSEVRVHATSEAAALSRELNADAFTVGRDIFFDEGKLDPASREGQALLAHELTHVGQQGGFSAPVAQRAVVQREPPTTPSASGGPSAPPAAPITLQLGPLALTTFAELGTASRFLTAQLEHDANSVPEGTPARKDADDLIAQARAWDPYLLSKTNDPLDQAAVDQARVWYDAFVQARDNLDRWQKRKAQDDLEAAAAQAAEAQAALENVPAEFADLQRAAFLAKNDGLLHQIQEVVGQVLVGASAVLTLREEALKAVAMLGEETSRASEIVERCQPLIEAAHKVTSTFELMQGSLNLVRPEGATESDRSINQVSTAMGMVVPAASLTVVELVPLAGTYLVYVQQLVIVAQKLLDAVRVIAREHAHELNVLMIQLGDLNSVDWSQEPGGRETFDFMSAVMRAGGSEEIPIPFPKAVDQLLVENREEFDQGTGEEVKTTGFWFWKHADADQDKYWLMRHRDSVWRMLYGGSIAPPT